jgi:hypothetical protein
MSRVIWVVTIFSGRGLQGARQGKVAEVLLQYLTRHARLKMEFQCLTRMQLFWVSSSSLVLLLPCGVGSLSPRREKRGVGLWLKASLNNPRLRRKPMTCYRTFYSAIRWARAYQRALEFPDGTSPSPEFATSYVRKYPVGAKVPVYYNPDQPDQATLEPGLTRGDWMIPALGIAAMAFGIFALFFSR